MAAARPDSLVEVDQERNVFLTLDPHVNYMEN